MTIKTGDLVPNVNILFREGDTRPEKGTCPIGGEFVSKSTRELFAGKRVIQDTIREELPIDFQKAEYLKEHGMVDIVSHRKKLKLTLHKVLKHIRK